MPYFDEPGDIIAFIVRVFAICYRDYQQLTWNRPWEMPGLATKVLDFPAKSW
jgi:hypothetical protein